MKRRQPVMKVIPRIRKRAIECLYADHPATVPPASVRSWLCDQRSVICPTGIPAPAASGRASRRADGYGSVRSRGHHGHAAEWLALLHPQEQPAREARADAACREGRIGRRNRPAARVGAFPRAHGVQRHAAFQGRRVDCRSRANRCAHGTARQRLHLVRRDGLHVSTADRSCRHCRKGNAGVGGFRRRHDPRSAGDRQGTRRGDRRMARRPGRRRTRSRSAHSRPVLAVEVRGTAADWQAGDPEVVQP